MAAQIGHLPMPAATQEIQSAEYGERLMFCFWTMQSWKVGEHPLS
jgi:hypothetical protein